MRWIVAVCLFVGFTALRIAYAWAADPSGGLDDLSGRVLTECGLVSGLLLAAIGYLATQLAKARSGWEKDRSEMVAVNRDVTTAFNNLSTAHARLEGIVLALQSKGSG